MCVLIGLKNKNTNLKYKSWGGVDGMDWVGNVLMGTMT